jgi:cyclopropane fatty-acyl-phospholipid synthase-like methyltransferase
MKTLLRRLYFNLLYLSKPPWDSGISPPELLDYMQSHPAGRAIDLGCGTGTNVLTLAQAGWQTTGVDFIPRAIRHAKRKAKQAGLQVDLRQADVTSLDGITGPFDLALDMGCFHSLGAARSSYLVELNRILAPGGHWLLYSFLNPDTQQDGHGLTAAELDEIQTSLSLLWRQDGFDRQERPSAWFLFQKPIS